MITNPGDVFFFAIGTDKRVIARSDKGLVVPIVTRVLCFVAHRHCQRSLRKYCRNCTAGVSGCQLARLTIPWRSGVSLLHLGPHVTSLFYPCRRYSLTNNNIPTFKKRQDMKTTGVTGQEQSWARSKALLLYNLVLLVHAILHDFVWLIIWNPKHSIHTW